MEKGLKRVVWWTKAMRYLAQDPNLCQIIEESHGEGLRENHALFRSMLRAICGQQVSNAAALKIQGNVLAAAKAQGGALAAAVKALGDDTLRRCGMSPIKVKAALALSEAMCQGKITRARLEKLTDAALMETLCAYPGVGPWTAKMIMIFGLNRPDVLAYEDFGVRAAGEALFGSQKAFLQASASWHPYCTAATWLLWRSRTKTPVEY